MKKHWTGLEEHEYLKDHWSRRIGTVLVLGAPGHESLLRFPEGREDYVLDEFLRCYKLIIATPARETRKVVYNLGMLATLYGVQFPNGDDFLLGNPLDLLAERIGHACLARVTLREIPEYVERGWGARSTYQNP